MDDEIKQVGKVYPYEKNGRKIYHKFSYTEIDYDLDGWVDVDRFLPEEYELVTLWLEEGIKNGWHTSAGWKGFRLKDYDVVIYWKKPKYLNILH